MSWRLVHSNSTPSPPPYGVTRTQTREENAVLKDPSHTTAVWPRLPGGPTYRRNRPSAAVRPAHTQGPERGLPQVATDGWAQSPLFKDGTATTPFIKRRERGPMRKAPAENEPLNYPGGTGEDPQSITPRGGQSLVPMRRSFLIGCPIGLSRASRETRFSSRRGLWSSGTGR